MPDHSAGGRRPSGERVTATSPAPSAAFGTGGHPPWVLQSSLPPAPSPARPHEPCWAASVFGSIDGLGLVQRGADAFGVGWRPPVRRGDGGPSVDHEGPVFVAV